MKKEHGRMKSLFLVVGVVMTIGCTKPNPKSCVDNHCSDPELPFCDIDGTIGGEPNTCVAVSCTPGAFETCQGDRALTCNSSGDNYELVACEHGCSVDAGGCQTCDAPECEKHIIPRYLPTICDELSNGGPLNVTSTDTLLDTSNELNCSQVVPQTNGPELCVVRHSTITIAQNLTYRAIGPRALALVADRDVTIAGIVDVSAEKTANGAGGGFIKSGSCSNLAGGGAGGRTGGGHGGTTTDGGAANGGAAQTHPSSLTVLPSGTQSDTGTCAPGGAGGGITLISCRGKITLTGVIDANGGGGSASKYVGNEYLHAGGGGAGGTIVLQAMMLDITGSLFANGGGGGGSCNGPCPIGQSATSGADGQRSTERAQGGSGSASGGLGGTFAAPGSGSGQTGGAGGGGGGSGGFILTYAPQSSTPILSPVVVSPRLETHEHIPTN